MWLGRTLTQFLQRSGNMRFGVAPLHTVGAQQLGLDVAIVLPLLPVVEVAVTEAVRSRRVGK